MNEVISLANNLRNKSQDLRNFIAKTDDLDDQDDILDKFDLITEQCSKMLSDSKIKYEDVFECEQKLLKSGSELDLLVKQIKECDRLNKELAAFDARN